MSGIRRETYERRLVAALAEGATQVEAGRRAGVTDRTVRRRLDEPEFLERVRTERAAMLGRASGRSAALVVEAMAVVQTLLGSDDEPIQLRAAQLAIDTARKFVTDDEVQARLSRLEHVAEHIEEAEA